MEASSATYDERLVRQIKQFERGNVEQLPRAFHYWSQNYIAPKLLAIFGSYKIDEIFAKLLTRDISPPDGGYRFASLGSGDCENVEIKMAKYFHNIGITDFKIDCYELSDGLRERAADSYKNWAWRIISILYRAT